MDVNPIQITLTCGSEAEALNIASALIDSHLAACVQVSGPVTSVYRWKGQVETEEEWLCFAKTVEEKYQAAQSKILEMHSYDNPEIIAVAIVAGSPEYLKWLSYETMP